MENIIRMMYVLKNLLCGVVGHYESPPGNSHPYILAELFMNDAFVECIWICNFAFFL